MTGDLEVRVRVLSRTGCHLCDVAEATVREVCAGLPEPCGVEVQLVDDVPELVARYGEQVPVVFVDGRMHDYWRVDPARLRAALGSSAR